MIPEYPILCSDKYEWSIKIEKTIDDTYLIITTHGQKGGKQIIHTNEIIAGKSNRTMLEQAILESNRKWENKKTKDLYTIKGDASPPSSKAVRPMLASTFSFDLYKKESRAFKIDLPAFAQRKYDGIRCLSYIKHGRVILESRRGVEFENFETLKSQLKPILEKLPNGFYFDGELYTTQIPFETISGLIRLTEKKALRKDKEQIDKIEYHIYDFFDTNEPFMTCKDRFQMLYQIMDKNVKNAPLCKSVETFVINYLNDLKEMHDNFVKEGYEGIMIRDMSGVYESNKRSRYLQKYKVFMEEEFFIVGFHDGTGDESGAIIWDCKTAKDKLFSVRPRGTVESRKQLFIDGQKYINKYLTVIFQEYSEDGIPRFPVGKAVREIY
jgi:ATP-dependent DNA ligase